MILLNTTFYVHLSVKDAFLKWAADIYLPSAIASGLLNEPLCSRLLIEVQEGCEGYAVQMRASTIDDAVAWHDGEGASLRADITRRFGERIVFFTTYMERVDLKK